MSSQLWMTASAIGSSIRAVAVLDIHMLSTAAAAMKPNTSRRPSFAPKRLIIPSAIRRCAPLFSMAVESMNPPIRSMISGSPTACAACDGGMAPTRGSSAMGISAVTGIGTASVIHQAAHSVVTATVQATAGPESRISSPAARAARGPANSMILFSKW